MGKIEGIKIQNYGVLKDVVLGRTLSNQEGEPLGNLVAIIGPSGNGKSTLADAVGFLSDCLEKGVEEACDAGNRGGYEHLVSQGCDGPICFELYYREKQNTRPITYEIKIHKDESGRPYVLEERLRQRAQSVGRPLSFLHLHKGEGYAFVGTEGGQDEAGNVEGEKVEVSLSDLRRLGVVTLGAMKQYSRIENFLTFMRSWFLCYFSPDAARSIQTAAPNPHLDRIGSNINNVAQFMFRENRKEFAKILEEIQTKLPGIREIRPLKLENGQMVLQFYEKGLSEPIYSSRMSDGTLKLFAYYLLLHEKSPRQLVFVEEPENGLYHQYLKDLATEMKAAVGTGYSRQLFVTTHSPFFVNALSPHDVWVLTKDETGFSNARRASDYEFVKELAEEGVEVGDMWYSHYFG